MKTHEQTHPSFSASKADKTNGLIAGLFFITATVSAILGIKLYDPLLASRDFLSSGAQHANQIISGAISELILACANVGTGIMLYPYLRRFNESMGLGYVAFRVLEVVMILIGVVSVLSLSSLSRDFTISAASDAGHYRSVGKVLIAAHDWTFIMGPLFMLGVNTSIYSYVFYRTGLVPRRLATLGLVGVGLVFIAALLSMFGVIGYMSLWSMLLSLPIASYEMILAGWLIVKGFNAGAARMHNTRGRHQVSLALAQ